MTSVKALGWSDRPTGSSNVPKSSRERVLSIQVSIQARRFSWGRLDSQQ